MKEELKPVPTEVVETKEASIEPQTMYCRAYDKDKNSLGCTAKSSESSCQTYAQNKGAKYYSYTTNSC